MIDNLLYRFGAKEKPRHEKVKDTVTDTIHSIADSLDEMVGTSRKKGSRAAKKARERVEHVAEGMQHAAGIAPTTFHELQEKIQQSGEESGQRVDSTKEQILSLLDTLLERAGDSREHVAGTVAEGASEASKKSTALLAALGALTADWEEVAKSFANELSQQVPGEKEISAKAGRAKQRLAKKLPRRRKKQAPGLGFSLLRLGLGYRYVEALRGMDYSEYINEGAGRRMSAARESHPIAWYRDLLDTTLLPNASLVALAEIVGTALVAVGYITGVNRRMASLFGIVLTGNNLLLDYTDHEKRGEHLVSLISQGLLLRTGG